MRFLSLLLLTFIIKPCAAQLSPLKFKGDINMDSYVDLDFINDTTCIRWAGSVSWGGNYDTLSYKISGDTVYLRGGRSYLITKTKIKSNDFKDELSVRHYRGRGRYAPIKIKGLKKIIVLIEVKGID